MDNNVELGFQKTIMLKQSFEFLNLKNMTTKDLKLNGTLENHNLVFVNQRCKKRLDGDFQLRQSVRSDQGIITQ